MAVVCWVTFAGADRSAMPPGLDRVRAACFERGWQRQAHCERPLDRRSRTWAGTGLRSWDRPCWRWCSWRCGRARSLYGLAEAHEHGSQAGVEAWAIAGGRGSVVPTRCNSLMEPRAGSALRAGDRNGRDVIEPRGWLESAEPRLDGRPRVSRQRPVVSECDQCGRGDVGLGVRAISAAPHT